MRRLVPALVLLLAAALLAACAGFDPQELDPRTGSAVKLIRDDPGGDLLAYEDRFRRWARDGARAKVDGLCASACTLVLAHLPADRVCLTGRARFGFHSARLAGHYQVASLDRRAVGAVADLASLEMYLRYPDWLRREIDRHSHRWDRDGMLPPANDLLVLDGRRFRAHGHPSC